MQQELNYKYDPINKKITKRLTYKNSEYGTDGQYLYIGLFRIFNINKKNIISKSWIRADSGHASKFINKEDRDIVLKKLGLIQYRKRDENMNYRNRIREMQRRFSERKLTDVELKDWKNKLFQEFKMQASNINNVSDQAGLLKQIYNSMNKLRDFKEKITQIIRENYKESSQQDLDDIAYEKYHKKYKDLDSEEQKYVMYIYNERNFESIHESLKYKKGDSIIIPSYLQDKNKKQRYTGTIIDITPEEYYKIKFKDGTVALYDSYIWR